MQSHVENHTALPPKYFSHCVNINQYCEGQFRIRNPLPAVVSSKAKIRLMFLIVQARRNGLLIKQFILTNR